MKVDFKKSLASYTAKRDLPELIEVPRLQYLMVDGAGDPNTSTFGDALTTLYPVAYKIKFASKQMDRDYVVPPLEALWWANDMSSFTDARDKSQWRWKAMVMVPDWITNEMFEEGKERAALKEAPPLLSDLRLDALVEGLCVQALHVGSFDDEGPLLERMHNRFLPEQMLTMTGHHHEIYLSDPRKTEPAKLRTILRQPVKRT